MFPYILVLVPVSFFVSMLKPNLKINLDLLLQQKVHKIEHLEQRCPKSVLSIDLILGIGC